MSRCKFAVRWCQVALVCVLLAGCGGSGGGGTGPVNTPAQFVLTGSMTTPRYVPTATLLQDGKVLIAGGENAETALASAEIYDPETGTFTPTGSLNTPRYWASAVLLGNGSVLVIGGYNSDGFQASAELYDPTNGTFTLWRARRCCPMGPCWSRAGRPTTPCCRAPKSTIQRAARSHRRRA